ncbi:DUF4834 domain-containing protein [Runella rosea]|jgi:hypothetical protein|uniref:DUF4834 domain-containing protein n=3 Tax=Runella TaxID=105 RepID=A0A344TJR2_9BACT|nr:MULTISPECIES: DUF4834 domain-containing protein [Runella]AXE18883.1 DUF4834 domain-containing protein [Runella rosea]MCP1385981.1 DUF4834 family protein [Runella salmonicolor]NBB18161.1 DUF4834 domain-containing protein [Runella sp. CRIBMP]RDB05138.1 DUF4834 domain-containing protein [Runella aurantiaca]
MKILFNILLIFIFFVAFVPPFRRFMFWLLVGRQLVKEQKKANQPSQRREGEIRVEPKPTSSDQSRFRGGEYVDYEEVKD